MKYRKKPVVIEAWPWPWDELTEIPDPAVTIYVKEDNTWIASIKTPEGNMIASEGDWIIRGVKGEYYPCKPDIFKETYEPAEPDHE